MTTVSRNMDLNSSSPVGALYVLATPIGNLEDITLRAIRVLRNCDIIFAEDTRRTRILLEKYHIRKKLQAYHAFNEHGRTPELLSRVISGEKVVLVSDAGSPCIADPGFLLIREAVAAGIEPQIIPGVSAMTFSVAASALPSDKFAFYGFLPVKSGRRSAVLERIAAEDKTCVIFESPHRMSKLLTEIQEFMGGHTQAAIVREATKLHEEILRDTVAGLLARTQNRSWKGECVLVVRKQTQAEAEQE